MVGIYKFNVVLDSLRLISKIAQRRTLFQWSMLDSEVGDYHQHYPEYIPYQSSQPLLMQHLPEQYGRDAYQHLMQAKPQRLAQIKKLLAGAGITVAPTDESWSHILVWLNEQCVSSNEPAALAHNSDTYCEFSTRPVFYSLLMDIALLLGEHAIELRPDFSWAFWGDVPMRNPTSLGREGGVFKFVAKVGQNKTQLVNAEFQAGLDTRESGVRLDNVFLSIMCPSAQKNVDQLDFVANFSQKIDRSTISATNQSHTTHDDVVRF